MPKPTSIIFHVDMNAYFASVEQACNPFIVGKPVAVVSSMKYSGAAILARSYEAKARGVKTFSRFGEALAVCPDLIPVPIDHLKYYDINSRLANIMYSYTPTVETYSIDEFFLDLTSYFKYHKISPLAVAEEIKQRVADEIHPVLKCSVGIGPNKLLAKIGSNYKKPDGLTLVDWENRHQYLDKMDLDDIWGIGRNSIPKLNSVGVYSTKEIRNLSSTVLNKLVGSYWRRLLQIADGQHYENVHHNLAARPAKSMQHAHTLSKATNDIFALKALIRKQAERLSFRLRKHKQLAGIISLGIRPSNQQHYGWGYLPNIYKVLKLPYYTDNGYDIFKAGLKVLNSIDLAEIDVRLLVIGVSKLIQTEQLLLLDGRDHGRNRVDHAADQINNKYGQFTLRTGDILNDRTKERELSVHRPTMTFHPDS